MTNFPSRGSRVCVGTRCSCTASYISVSKPDQARTTIPSPSPAGGHGFRPTDEELVSYYSRLKMHGGYEQAVSIIAEVNMCDFEPWVLPGLSAYDQSNDPEWYLFCPRNYKDVSSHGADS
ncbi:putative proteinC DOMAIN-CONTAINING PROTEIN 82-RELATED [Salix viminalis]|uniref:NAC domain-containing protein n=1 Tax=Salix viminalis TaxID=40686 RepID=A0A9Q0UGH0_SALVM|nr:putative proteinC DOMAIN-CONTAINING PROTEIN 82-RELATED [Salix viminalis]